MKQKNITFFIAQVSYYYILYLNSDLLIGSPENMVTPCCTAINIHYKKLALFRT